MFLIVQGTSFNPVLAFSKYLLTHPQIMNGECSMFDGASQYDRLNALLKEVVNHQDHVEEFEKLGLDAEYFGTHSIRKGSITHGACGVVNGPPIASICICANWKMPGIMNCYMRYESAGDEFVGRSVCGRARLGKRFAESCPYFDFSDCDKAVKALRMQELDDWIEARLPRDCEAKFFVLFKFCLLHSFFTDSG
jgi:hypothetical protein